ncbi:MAG: hypothetical protein ABII26_00005 [Pseudomonadota bacterium]
MDENTILKQLEELAASLSIQIRYDAIKKEGTYYPGGLCRVKGENILFINSKADTRDKIEALAKAVSRFDLSQVYLRPGLREFLEGYSPQGG